MRAARYILFGILGIAIVLVGFLFMFGRVNRYYHVPQRAAAAARAFAQRAFVERDSQRASLWLADKLRAEFAVDRLTDAVKQMHPNEFPTEIEPVEYEPMPGQQGMIIYLIGKNGDETMHYRFVMSGENEIGYLVAGFFRGNGPYPSSPLRKPL